jgi:polar amino acid transport system substrate-binding protein
MGIFTRATVGSGASAGWAAGDRERSRARGRDPLVWLPAALLILGWAMGVRAQANDATPLRLCADPANLPFSSDRAETPGLYVEIGEAIGRTLGRPVTMVWSLTYFGKRTVRTTLLTGQCDALIGLPGDEDFMGPRLIFSKPLLQVGYVVAGPKTLRMISLDDLKGHHIAVQFGSTPQSLLAERDDVTTVTFREPEEAMAALATGKVDAAFVWGPVAGYMNRTMLHDAFNVVPIAGKGMQWPVTIGFSSRQTALRDEVNRAIDAGASTIAVLKAKYGFPDAPPMTLGANKPDSWMLAASDAQQSDGPRALSVEQPSAASNAQAPPDAHITPPDIAEGQEIFNGICAHCHGPNAVQAERRINLRLLQHRYGDKMDEIFRYTVTHGRPTKGMPNWREVLSDDQFDKILAFLHAVQAD